MRIGLPSQIFNPCTDQDRSLAHPLSTNGRDHPAYGRASPTAAAVCAAPVTRAAQKRGKRLRLSPGRSPYGPYPKTRPARCPSAQHHHPASRRPYASRPRIPFSPSQGNLLEPSPFPILPSSTSPSSRASQGQSRTSAPSPARRLQPSKPGL